MELSVLGVPTSAGAYGVGQEHAPMAIRDAGLLSALTGPGVAVTDEGDSRVARFRPDPSSPTAQNLGRVVDVAEELAPRVQRAVGGGSIPLVLGGDCTITLGVIAGFHDAGAAPAVAYVDGDLDLSTPATTRSGVLDAMGVAHMLAIDGCADPLANLGGHRPLMRGRDLAMIGFEDIDEDEETLLDDRGVHRFPASEVRDDPSGAAGRALDAVGEERPLIVHFDLDAVDSIDCPLAHFPHFNTGVPLDQAARCLASLCAAPNFAALVVTEVNPHHDPDDIYLPRLVGVLADALAAGMEVSRRR